MTSSNELKPFKHEAEDEAAGETEEEGPKHTKYTVDFGMYEKSSYMNLDSETISKLTNSNVVIKIITKGKPAPAAEAAKGKKGAPAAEPADSVDIVLAEIVIALGNLIMDKACVVKNPSVLSPPEERVGVPAEDMNGVSFRSISEKIDPTRSSLFFRAAADNDLAEYVAGGVMLQWSSANAAQFSNRGWGLHMPPLPEPKSKPKVPPPEEEVKAAYLDALVNFVPTQANVATFSMTLEPSNPSAVPLPPVASWVGEMKLDREACDELSLDEIKEKSDIWSLEWISGSKAFVDRGTIRSLLTTLDLNDDQDSGVEITLKKTPTEAGAALEGDEQVATGRLNLGPLSQPGNTVLEADAIELNDKDGSNPVLSLSLTVSRPLRSDVSGEIPGGEGDLKPADMSSLHQVGGGKSNRNVLEELRNEIREVITEIAREYVAIYPAAVENGPEADKNELQQRKLHFLHHLTSSGLYHRLKETLKPRIQRAARQRYGAKSRALGLAGAASFDSMAIGAETELPMDQLIGEFYAYLVQESNTVLNAMYRETVVDCDISELEQPPAIDDEHESGKQLFKRLKSLAYDAESEGNYYKAEQRHLERIQLLSADKSFKGNNGAIRNAYTSFALMLLHRAAHQCRQKEAEASQNSFSMAREALRVALNAESDPSSDWKLQLDLGILLLELGQQEEGYKMLQLSISSQLQESPSFSDFDGYESDKLCPVNPLCYVFLSIYYLEQKKPLSARKATRLAVKSYAEGGFQPPYEEHGKPKRTATLAFSNAALYASERGLNRLGSSCMKWAKDCDDAATDKADARNLPSDSVPMIRHLLKRSSAEVLHNLGDGDFSLVNAQDCITVAVDKNDLIEGYVCYAKITKEMGGDPRIVRDNFCEAIAVAASIPKTAKETYGQIPLSTYIDAGRIMIASGNYEEAINMMLLGCSVYASCALFLLVGISCLRLDRLQDAEDALEEANLIDNRNADVWAYMTLLCLGDETGKRLAEGARCLDQVLRLGLEGPGAAGLYRELAMAHISVDKLSTAEDLLRRGIRVEMAISQSGKSSAHTRKLLADVLVGQNLAAVAVDEYRSVIADEEADVEMRLEACDKCIGLLSSLGRDEEIRSLAAISDSLKGLSG